MTLPMQPEAPVQPAGPPQPPKPPWTPFQPLPTDEEAPIAAMRKRRLARLIDSAKFESFPPEWRQVAILEYERMKGIEAQAMQAAQMAAAGPKAQQAPPQLPGGAK